MEKKLEEIDIIWSHKNVFIIEYNCDNHLNTWIPIKWLPLDNCLFEEERILSAQQQLNHILPPPLPYKPSLKSRLHCWYKQQRFRLKGYRYH